MLGQESFAKPVGYNTGVKQTIFAVEDDSDISRLVRHHLEVDPDVSDCTLATRYSISLREVRQIRATLNTDLFAGT